MNPMYSRHIKELRREHNGLLDKASKVLGAIKALETLTHSPAYQQHQPRQQPQEKKHHRLSPKARRHLSRVMRRRWAEGKMQGGSKHKKGKSLHWTKRPENRARVMKMLKKANKARGVS